MAVSKALRYQVLRRDSHTCRYCGRGAPEVRLTVDHVVAQALGGRDVPENLVTACSDCNSGKSATPADAAVVTDVAEDALRWARAQQVAADQMLADLQQRRDRRQRFRAEWDTWTTEGAGGARVPIPLPDSWAATIDALVAAGLPFELLMDALDVAMSAEKVTPANTFRYMCGVAWNRVAEIQAAAREHVGVEPADDGSDWAEIPRDELEDHLHRFLTIGEAFLQTLPVWVHEKAERLADHDWYAAGDPDASRTNKLPDVIRHVGTVLSECQIEPPRTKADDY